MLIYFSVNNKEKESKQTNSSFASELIDKIKYRKWVDSTSTRGLRAGADPSFMSGLVVSRYGNASTSQILVLSI